MTKRERERENKNHVTHTKHSREERAQDNKEIERMQPGCVVG